MAIKKTVFKKIVALKHTGGINNNYHLYNYMSSWTPSWTWASNVPLLLSRLMVFLGKVSPAGGGRWSFLYWVWWGHTWNTGSSSGPPKYQEWHGYTGESPIKCHESVEGTGDSPIWEEAGRDGTLLLGEVKAQDDLSVHKYLKKRGVGRRQANGVRLCPVVPRARTRDHRHKLEHRNFPLNTGKASLRHWSSGTGSPEAEEYPSWGSSKVTWTWPWAPCSGWPCWKRSWTRWHPEVLANSPILECFLVVLYEARSWGQWSLWVSSKSGYSVILFYSVILSLLFYILCRSKILISI